MSFKTSPVASGEPVCDFGNMDDGGGVGMVVMLCRRATRPSFRRTAGEDWGEHRGELHESRANPPPMWGGGRQARCFIVPAFSFANGRESDSVLEVDLKLALESFRRGLNSALPSASGDGVVDDCVVASESLVRDEVVMVALALVPRAALAIVTQVSGGGGGGKSSGRC